MKKRILISCVAVSMAAVAFGADEVRLGEGTYVGTACPAGSMNVVLGANHRSAKFEFSPFTALAGQAAQKKDDWQQCDIEFPVQVAPGYHVSIAPLTYQTSVSLPYGTTSQMHLNYYYEYTYGVSQQNFQYSFWGEQIKDYAFQFPKKDAAPFWTNCGEDIKVRLNINLMAHTNRFNHEARMALNGLEGFELRVEKCN